MASKFGQLVERLVGAQVWFVPDGENLGTEMDPDIVSAANPPGDSDWDDYDLGRVNQAAYDPRTRDRTREWAKPTGGYQERTDTIMLEDAFNFTMIDVAESLFDQLMFGLASAPVANTPQQAFASAIRHKDGWVRLRRINEDGTTLCLAELHVRLRLQTIPADSNEPQSPVLRLSLLGDGGAEDTIVFNPTPAE
ncbi:MAG: hypothetical protein ACNA8L_10290 [Luteolibacter sp.]